MVSLTDAANICRPLDARTFKQRGPQDETLDLADKLIGEQRLRENAEIAAADVGRAFLDAAYTLETCSINLRAYSRGMVSKELAAAEIQRARASLAIMEGALQ